jgi:hypothetical protein
MAMKRTADVCLLSGLVGIMLGSVPYAILRLNGYDLTKSDSPSSGASDKGPGSCGKPPMVSGPRPKRDLTTLVQKLDLLTGDIGITLTAEQAVAVNDCLRDVEKSAKMSDDDAKAKHDQLMAVLNENQKARLKAIELPQPGGPGAICPMTGKPKPAVPGTREAGTPFWEDENQNPFQQGAGGKAVKSLHERLASKVTAPEAETPKAPPTKAETPKAQPPKAETASSGAK